MYFFPQIIIWLWTILLLSLNLCHFIECKISEITVFGSCCQFQGEYINGSCAGTGGGGTQNLRSENIFPDFINIPHSLIPVKFRNSSLSQQFRLEYRPFSCANGTFNLRIPLVHFTNKTETIPKVVVVDEKQISILPFNAFLKYGQDNFYPDDYCFNRVENDIIELSVCNPSCTPSSPCVTKCCDIDEVWDVSLLPDGPLRCRPSGQNIWTPKIFSTVNSKIGESGDNTPRPHIITSHPKYWCTEGNSIIHSLTKRPAFEQKKLFKVVRDGNVWLKVNRKDWKSLTPGAYCIDGAQNFPSESGETNLSLYSGNYDRDTIVLDCSLFNEDEEDICKAGDPGDLYGISLIVASIFLLFTVIVYLLLWEKQNIHGWTSLAYFASLFLMYIFTALVEFNLGFEAGEIGAGWTCYSIGVIAHFFWLSSFSWMSALNFDLWWTFRALLPTGSQSKGRTRFLMYVIFSVGIPLSIVITAITLDYLFGDDLESDLITPDYGTSTCFLDKKSALFPYLYGPIGVLLSCNLIFFTVTVYDMYKIQQSTKFAAMSSSKNSQQKQSVILFAKLFLLMGIPWGFEVISWATTPCGQISWYWSIFDMINIFQAAAIFFTFVCKSETRNSLESKFPKFKRFMSSISITPEKAESIVDRRPALKFLIKPFTRRIKNAGGFSSGNTLSTTLESSRISSRHQQHSVKVLV